MMKLIKVAWCSIHGIKNRTKERIEKESGSRTSGSTGVGSVVEPVTS
jgi:hypothetical protein